MLACLLPDAVKAHFCYDYDNAVTSFYAALSVHQSSIAKQLTVSHPFATSDVHPLATRAALLGDANASRILIVNSGTHGVEGYCGSAIQSFLLHRLACGDLSLGNDNAILFVHALNPWGMRWARRCDEKGIDLNRNFVDFGRPPRAHDHYPVLRAILQETQDDIRVEKLHALAQTLGQTAFEQCVSGGQYSDAWAPFYGGTSPAFGHTTCQKLINAFDLDGREIVFLDLHTGLGPWSYGELICDHDADTAGARYAQALFGPAVAMALTGQSYSVPKHGLLDFFWHRYMTERGCFLTLEFGTYGTEPLFKVILDDHLLWKNDDLGEPGALSIQREAMLDHFCPKDLFWQQSVLFRSWQVCQRVLSSWQRS